MKEMFRKIINYFKNHELLFATIILILFTILYFLPVSIGKSTLFTPGDGNIMSNGPWEYVGKIRYWGMDSWGYMLNEVPGTILIKKYLAQGIAPMWNPYGGVGAPLLSSSQTGLWNVFHIPLYIIDSLKAFDFYLMSKMFFAALFSYMFFRELGLRKESAAFGAIAFGFSGFFMTWLNLWFLTIDSFLPLVLFLILKYIKSKNIKWMIGNGLLLAGLILMGNVQPVLLISVFAGFFYIFYDNTLVELRKKRDFQVLLPLILGFAVAYGLAGLITLPYLLAFAKDLSLAWNIHHPGVSAVQMADFKSLFGFWFTPYKVFNHYQFGPVWQSVYIMYLGSIATFMAPLAILTKDKRLRRLIIFMMIFSFFILSKISFNPFYTSWLDHVIFFNQIAYNKYMATFFFVVAFMAAVGLDRTLKAELKAKELLAPIGFFALLAFVYIYKSKGFLNVYHFNYTYPVVTTFLFAGVALALTVFAITFSSKYFTAPRKKLIISVVGWVFVLAIAFESFAYSPIFRLPSEHNPINEPPYISFLQGQLKNESYQRVAPIGLVLAPSMQWVYQIQSINMFDAFMPQRFFDFSEKLIGCSTNFYMVTHDCPATAQNKFVDLLGAKYFLSDNYLSTSDGKELIYDKEIKIYKNNNVQPRAFVAYNYEVAKGENVLDSLKKSSDVANNLVLEKKPSFPAVAKPITAAVITSYTPNKVEITVESKGDGLLVLSDLNYPDWEARVDGKKVEIQAVDYIFRGVEVKNGDHQVIFEYKPVKLLYLSLVSMFAIITSCGYLFFDKYLRRKK